MIVTNKEHALDYLGINEGLDKALRFIAGTDFDTLEDGNVLIDGQDVRVNVKHMRTSRRAAPSSKPMTISRTYRCCWKARRR